ncbi:MAG: SPOR domain-containing protein [Deltaproteobacteria bacterium]|nr:SPOR domain-containing protein [Deltaproteobacteria bacterium]MBW2042057.1 SPOR domain-containing protein [Deltaproteobacteria bacterium]
MAGGDKKGAGPSPGRRNKSSRPFWIAGIIFVSGWMFFLGVLVGRGTAPIRYDIQAIQKELADAKAALFESEIKRFKIPTESPETPLELSFYDALKESAQQPPIRPKAPAAPKVRISQKPETPSGRVQPTPSSARAPERTERAPKPPDPAMHGGTGEPENRLTLQVAAFPSPGDAGKLVEDLRKRGYPAYSEAVMISGKGVWYRVRIGSFTTREGAAVMLEELKKERFEPIIVNRNAK